MYQKQQVIAIIPAFNEELSIGLVVAELLSLTDDNQQVIDKVIVCDNGSDDTTGEIAAANGAHVVIEPCAGYGRACLKALRLLTEKLTLAGKKTTTKTAHITDQAIVVFIDADYAFYTQQTLELLEAVVNGADLVVGSRVLGVCLPKALTTQQRVGNLLACNIIQAKWQHQFSDIGPFRAIRYGALKSLNMQNETFGWTVEMQIKAIIHQLVVKEIPVNCRQRIGVSKISGTLKGAILAGVGILGMIAKLWSYKSDPYPLSEKGS